jgi:hypothetical protein
MSGAMIDAARDWARRGFRIFPLENGGKFPRIKDWDWTEGATADLDMIEAWWSTFPEANIGVLTDGLIVLDVDVRNGKPGFESLLALDAPLDTLIVNTPSGGKHVYYSGPNRANGVNRLGEGLDVRSYHGYVVAPGSWLDASIPSNRGVGGYYTIDNDQPVMECPAEIVARLDAPRDRQSQAPLVELDLPSSIQQARLYAEQVEPAVLGAGADHYTYGVCCRVKDFGLSQQVAFEVLAEHYLPRCTASRTPVEQLNWLERKVENAYAYGTSAPGIASPAAEFGGIQIAPPLRAPGAWFRHGQEWDNNVSWLFYETLPVSGVALLTGPSQGGKTFVALELARALATGKSFFGVEPDERGGTAMLFAGTEGSGFAKRLEALQEEEPLPIAGREVSALGQGSALAELQVQLKEESAYMLERYGVPLRLVVIETLSAAGLVKDENDNAEAAAAMAALAVFGRNIGALVVVTHHPPKSGTGERGAGAFRNSADYVLEVLREGKAAVRTLELTKGRDAQQRALGLFTLSPVKLGVDAKGRDVISMTVSSSTGVPRSAGVADKLAEEFNTALEWAIVERGVQINGETWVLIDEVKAQFREITTGSKDHSNLNKRFKKAIEVSTESAAIDQTPFGGELYVRKKVFT